MFKVELYKFKTSMTNLLVDISDSVDSRVQEVRHLVHSHPQQFINPIDFVVDLDPWEHPQSLWIVNHGTLTGFLNAVRV